MPGVIQRRRVMIQPSPARMTTTRAVPARRKYPDGRPTYNAARMPSGMGPATAARLKSAAPTLGKRLMRMTWGPVLLRLVVLRPHLGYVLCHLRHFGGDVLVD